jgi:hypothetical protein
MEHLTEVLLVLIAAFLWAALRKLDRIGEECKQSRTALEDMREALQGTHYECRQSRIALIDVLKALRSDQ